MPANVVTKLTTPWDDREAIGIELTPSREISPLVPMVGTML